MINVNERGKHLRDDEEKGTLAVTPLNMLMVMKFVRN